MVLFAKWLSLIRSDPSGELAHGLDLVSKYRGAIDRQHSRMMDAWMAKDHTTALVELHFLLIAMNRINDGLGIVARIKGGETSDHILSQEFGDYRDARNHFEHLNDRLYGSKKNAPQPIVENGTSHTPHFGLRLKEMQFYWGTKTIDISKEFFASYLNYVDCAEHLVSH